MTETITYDYPLNEMIRVCLRLEQLFQTVDHQLHDQSIFGTRTLIHTITDILQILDRPDLKTKLAKELGTLQTNLQRIKHTTNDEKMVSFKQQLNSLTRNLIDRSGKIGHRLRDIELLNNLRLHMANPGGGSHFDLPAFHYWLEQPASIRLQSIEQWLADFIEIREIITLVLEHVRSNAKIEEKTAARGFHQEMLDPNASLRMIRINIPKQTPAYPEISIGRHFFSVRFFFPYIETRPTQYSENLLFNVVYCYA